MIGKGQVQGCHFPLAPNRLWEGSTAVGKATFYGLKAGSNLPHLMPLYQSAEGKVSLTGVAAQQPLCWVWKNPNQTMFFERFAKPVPVKST